ncbi:UDP-N-acetylmuramoyl-L-alanine--D-glutamate ligase [Longimonas halophila]|uniref:UDP-N-acetylmuramoylalanine--D-glutamate ligase n=1 Tax=Longimonas halophila TaxID=1469170 RepID=A0A2H3NM97_9BACT|nr:UDP-N-acetylmuramoyl-L-alanine--D-glutamate ligase [Longimonas halophila]PEN05756.1 UDP-N-acetylmuramoyl-L-alanine--D-glutamate ligase [Longimonas halophila]
MPPSLSDKAITIVGGARSGQAALRLLADTGAHLFLSEHGSGDDKLRALLDEQNTAHELGGHTERALDADLMVLSPGVPSDAPVVQQAHERGVRVVSEIEMAAWFCEAPIVAITGTNGKTTTTEWTGHVLRTAWQDAPERAVIVAGNVGVPFSDHARSAGPNDVVVLEVSSFQLDHVDAFRPRVSALLNITPDHLDRYGGSVEAYAASKARIMAQQTAGDTVVYNADNERTVHHVTRTHPPKAADGPALAAFSQTHPPERGIYESDGQLILRQDGTEIPLLATDDVALRGRHNRYNAMAVALIADAMDVPVASIRKGLRTFAGVPHRLESVRTHQDVLYVNDSKATNVEAVGYALESFARPVVLIAGGRDKGNDYAPLKPLVQQGVRAIIALGESADTVARELGPHADTCTWADTMEAAVHTAQHLAHPGDAVLLSPACSSFDMYRNYEERGDVFRAAVQAL